MCGIAGLILADASRTPDQGLLKAMGDAIAHRGPDAEGYLAEPGVGLVHRRLSIIDLAGGDQPIGNEDGSLQVVFNGEIYNYQSIRSDLEARGHRFRTHSDTEVLVHLYEQHGEHLVDRLRGMFAFALWDRPNRRLILARDRVGIKPLYFYRNDHKLIFASEPKAILADPEVSRRVDPQALEDYLAFGVVPGARSIFQGIERLPHAGVLVVGPDCLDRSPRRYWRLNFEPDLVRSVDDWREEVQAKINESTQVHMIADVPVGAFLSGGIDSSVIVGTAANQASGPLQTYSIGFNEARFSELPHAREVAARFGTQHSEEVVTPDAVGLLDELMRFYDEPFADSSAIPTYLVSKLAARHVKVVLSGDGGDEAFGGYVRYAHDLRESAARAILPSWLRRSMLGPLASVWPKGDWLPRPLRAKTTLTNIAREAPAAYANTVTLCREPLRGRLLSRDIKRSLNGHDPEALIREGYRQAPANDPLAGMIAADMGMLLPDDYLVKVDRASMACGLEVRPPFLDHELLELAARIPSRWKIHGGETKWILKQSFQQLLPSTILRRPKQGFEIPVDSWLRGPLKPLFEASVLDHSSRIRGLIDQETARRLFKSHLLGAGRHGSTLWSLLVLARWSEHYRPF